MKFNIQLCLNFWLTRNKRELPKFDKYYLSKIYNKNQT